MAAGMDVDRRPRLARGDEGSLHHLLLGGRPRRGAADLADHAGAHVGAPGAVQDLAHDLLGEVVDAAAVVPGVLVIVDVVAAAHDQVHAGAGRDAPEPFGLRREAAAGQLDDGVAALVFHHRHLAGSDVLEVEHVLAAGALQPAAVVHLPDVLERDLGPEIVVRARAGRPDVAQDVLVHQRAAERLGRDRTENGLDPALKFVARHCGSSLAAVMTFCHLTFSDSICLTSAAASPGSSAAPASRIFLITASDLMPLVISSDSFLTMSAGVPAGAATYHQGAASKPGNPCSAMVGTSGAENQRLAELTPSARSAPDWMCCR